MKGLILSGGHGSRLRPITYSQQKQLIPVANKPMLFYAIEDLIRCGVTGIGIVVGPNKDQVIKAVRSEPWQVDIEFITQDNPSGLAHAVKISRDYLGDDRFILYLGDNLMKSGSLRFAQDFAASDVSASLLLTTTDHPERYGIALVDEQNKIITKLVEKPKKPLSNLIIVGIYGLTPLIFEAISNIKPSWRNELEITDALQWLLEHGHTVRYDTVQGWWKDTGSSADLLEANRLVLENLSPSSAGSTGSSLVKGVAVIGSGSVMEDGVNIDGPVIIGRNCVVSDSRIGPNVSVGDNCVIRGSELSNSIIMAGSRITNAGRISGSVIGRDVVISKDGTTQALSLFLGDCSEVKL